jgi:hypothetical protein
VVVAGGGGRGGGGQGYRAVILGRLRHGLSRPECEARPLYSDT